MYYSQLGQDSFVDELLNKKENGFFIEIGANDGKSHSNTLFFEEKRNWLGICVEPLLDKFQELNEFRKSINLNICISDFDGDIVNYGENSQRLINQLIGLYGHIQHLKVGVID
jgi:hypothetical protein